ncbi:MAG: class I SAM-dependent methyltransferase, partial [Chloroflexi bacterium]|nr:class I SAM-dependent methyltransferase [Chloroflexota bacterium]
GVGRQELEAMGLQHRIQLEQRGAGDLDGQEEFDLVSMCLVMHEIRADLRPEALKRIWRALRPGGILISTDQYYPSRLEDFRREEFYTAVQDQAAEVIWGNRHLSREGLADLFASCGFQRSEFHVIHLPGQPSPRLVALAFK